jgi:hypothetical protein
MKLPPDPDRHVEQVGTGGRRLDAAGLLRQTVQSERKNDSTPEQVIQGKMTVADESSLAAGRLRRQVAENKIETAGLGLLQRDAQDGGRVLFDKQHRLPY